LLLFGVVIPGVMGAFAAYTVIRSRAGPDDIGESAAVFGALILGIASPYALYCTLFFGHGPAAACCAMSLALVNKHRPAAGALAGTMVLIDTPTAILAVAIGIWVLLRTKSIRAMVEFGLGGIPPVAVQLAYNTWIFDSPFTFAYAHKASGDLATIHAQGLFGFSIPTATRLFGLSFGTERGLFFHAPVLLLAFFGGKRAQPFLLMSLAYFLWIAAFVDWQAGASYAPRHLTPIIPCLSIAAGIAVIDRPYLRIVASLLLAYSACVTFSMIATFPYAMIPFDTPMLEQALPMLATGSIAPNLFGLTGFPALIPPLIVVVVLACIVGNRRHVIAALLGFACFAALVAIPVESRERQKIDSLSRATAFNGYPETAKNLCTHHDGYKWIDRAWACVPSQP